MDASEAKRVPADWCLGTRDSDAIAWMRISDTVCLSPHESPDSSSSSTTSPIFHFKGFGNFTLRQLVFTFASGASICHTIPGNCRILSHISNRGLPP
jgi:hypothetical protein